MLVILATVLVGSWLASTMAMTLARARPLGVVIVGNWEGFAFPSRPVAAAAVSLLGICYTLVAAGRLREVAKWTVWALLAALAFARMYLGQDHPLDVLVGLIVGMGISLIAYRVLTPNAIFPVTYGHRGRSAHLDVTGRRAQAIKEAVQDQLGLAILDMQPFGLQGSGGSTRETS